ncbi:Rv3654c family TadE-like protein [Streptomyces sp. NPDC058741]|uniref:Rv3654c family TadE-like protein n=1 Tax=Streptomyces sp. NPDC058741 TaxID=3346620 RepID=UPI003698AB28
MKGTGPPAGRARRPRGRCDCCRRRSVRSVPDLCHGRRGGFDRGSATVWSVGAIAVLCVVFGVVLALGQAVVVRHRAAGGADLAALAAADHWAEGATAACARAGRVARAQGVRLVRCEVAGEVSDVTAASGRGPFTAKVRARAGPPANAAAPVTACEVPSPACDRVRGAASRP